MNVNFNGGGRIKPLLTIFNERRSLMGVGELTPYWRFSMNVKKKKRNLYSFKIPKKLNRSCVGELWGLRVTIVIIEHP